MRRYDTVLPQLMNYLIECSSCEARIVAAVIGETEVRSEDGEDYSVTLAKCPDCGEALLGIQIANDELDENDEWTRSWNNPQRVWPNPPLTLSWAIPKEIRKSLWEAHLCLKARAFTASVAMSGRALEGIGRHSLPPEEKEKKYLMLGAGLKKLREGDRLLEWGTELAEDRNWAAHPSGRNSIDKMQRTFLSSLIASANTFLS